MKNLIIFTLSLFLFSCDSQQQSNEQNNMETSDEAESQTSNLEAEANNPYNLSEGTIQYVTEQYLSLKQALVEANSDAAKTSADNILNTLKKKDEVTDAVQQIMADAAHISSKNEIAHQREHFKSMSNKLYSLVKNSEVNEQTLYWQYCPMAFENQGAYWLSDNSEIRNPYFGDKMLKCGSTKETIN